MGDWLTDNYIKLLTVIRDIGEDGCEAGAIDAPKLRLAVQDRRQIVQHLINDEGLTQAEVAEKLSVSQATVSADLSASDKAENGETATLETVLANTEIIPGSLDGIYGGSGTPFVLLPRSCCSHFDAIFGAMP